MYKNDLELFQRSNETIWTDEYICKTLLESHLDESNDAASRKNENRANIINYINNNIKPSSKIIDLGCGPGLYSYELGKLGHNVLGVDFNMASFDYAHNNKCIKNFVEYKYGNYLDDEIVGNFDVAMMIFCDFGALIPNEQIKLLNKIKKLLKKDGILFFDIFGLSEMENIQEGRSWAVSQGNDFWSNEPYMLNKETKIYKNENTVGTRYYLVNQKNGRLKEFILWDQYYDENSIKKLIDGNGFDVIEINKEIVRYKEETLFVMAKNKI